MISRSKLLSLAAAVLCAVAVLGLDVVPALAVPAGTTTTITFSPSASVNQGDTANAIGQTKVTSSGAVVTIGNLELQTAADVNGNPTTCGLQTQFLSGTPTAVDSTGSATFALNTNIVGTIGYRMHYTQGSSYGTSFSPCADFTVSAPPCSGVTIAADLASGNGTPSAGGTYTWIVEIKVHACVAATGLKAQGGDNGWASDSVGSPSAGDISIKTNKKNQVITWTMDSLGAGADATLDLTITGTIKPNTPSGTVLGLTGPWSVTYSTDGGVTYQKSAYTGEVTVTVQ
jgi:hypothetical protein